MSTSVIIGQFPTRRGAEIAVEHLVQEHKISRSAVSVRPSGHSNTVGTIPSGGDLKPGNGNDAKLDGAIEVVVTVDDSSSEMVTKTLSDAGASSVS